MSAPAVAAEPLVHEANLRAFLEHHVGPAPAGAYAVERHRAGHSNETFFVTWGDKAWVLRRPPAGAFLPTAHDVLREYRILAALQGTRVRVPGTLLACDDRAVIGAPFYLMERVPGHVVRDRLPPALDAPSDRRRMGEELVDALAELHAVDWRAAGLDGLGKPDGFLARQLKRWSGQLELTEPHTRQARPVPDLWAIRDWLANHVPASPPTSIVHGDYKLDNVLFAPQSPARVSAVLDWEMSTLGDPLTDLGWMLSFWIEAGDRGVALPGAMSRCTAAPGFASRRELVARYEARTGRPTPDLTFYVVMATWKLAILLEGSYARHLAGATDDPFFAQMSHGVPQLAAHALEVARSGFR